MHHRFVLIPLQDDVKEHIWLMILLDLFERYMIVFLLLYIFLNYLRVCCLLELLHYVMALFSCLVETHIGRLVLSFRFDEHVNNRHKVSYVNVQRAKGFEYMISVTICLYVSVLRFRIIIFKGQNSYILLYCLCSVTDEFAKHHTLFISLQL